MHTIKLRSRQDLDIPTPRWTPPQRSLDSSLGSFEKMAQENSWICWKSSPWRTWGSQDPHLIRRRRFNGSGRRISECERKVYTDADVPGCLARYCHWRPWVWKIKLMTPPATGHRSRREQLLIQFFWGWGAIPILSRHQGDWYNSRSCAHMFPYPIGSMSAIYGNIYHQYTPNVSIYTIHGSYGYGRPKHI